MNFSAFDLNLLRVFDALMRERSVTRAGETIGLSQPAVSNALARLRHALNDELFVRRAHEMVPTPRAEALADQLREALAQIETAISGDQAFDPASAEMLFTLCGADFFSAHVMPPLSQRIASVAPGVSLRLLESSHGDVERLLRDNAIDAALERRVPMPDWVSSEVIMHSAMVVVAARDNPIIREAGILPGGQLPLDLFCELPHAMRSADGSMSGMVDEALATTGKTRRVMLALPQFHSVAVAVSVAGSGMIATLPDQTVRAVAKDLALEVYLPPVTIPYQELRLYWHRRHDGHPAHAWLRDQIRDVMASLQCCDGSRT